MTNQRPRHFSFQLQFERGAEADASLLDKITTILERGGAHVTSSSIDSEDGEAFATINAQAPDADAFWRKAKAKLITASRTGASKGMIAVCEGDDGWNDYLLLHHFDGSQRVDDIGHRRSANRAAE